MYYVLKTISFPLKWQCPPVFLNHGQCTTSCGVRPMFGCYLYSSCWLLGRTWWPRLRDQHSVKPRHPVGIWQRPIILVFQSV